MDEIFDGMNDRLKVSLADSTMIWIVHSAMYKAHEKSKSKEGIVTRLNEISKFYELAVLQLEGCLKFVQEEAESCDFDSDQQQVVTDLTDIRNRLVGRLEETENAILEKDRELKDRIDNEFNLRQALELKEKELARLQAKLEVERTKSEEMELIICNRVNADDEESEDGFCLLKNSVDQQVWNIKQKLEFDHEYIEDDSGDRSRGVDCKKVEEMSMEIDILKGTMDTAFGKMQNAICSFEMGPVGKQWRWSIEKDMISILVRGFVRDLKDRTAEEQRNQENNYSSKLREHWSDLMGDVTSLRQELEFLGCHSGTVFETHNAGNGMDRKERSKSLPVQSSSKSLKVGELDHNRMEQSEEDGDHLVAKMIKSHESIIRKKKEELNHWLKLEILQNKERRSRGRSIEPVSSKGTFRDVVMKLDSIINLNAKLGKTFGDIESVMGEESFPQRKMSQYDEKDRELGVGKSNVPCQSEGFALLSNSVSEESHHEITKLTLAKEELYMQHMVTEEVYLILMKSLAKEFCRELLDRQSEILIWDHICKFFINDMLKECNAKAESTEIEAYMRETIYTIVVSETLKNHVHELILGAEYEQREQSIGTDRLASKPKGIVKDNAGEKKNKQTVSYHIESLVREEIDWMVFCETFRSILASATDQLHRHQMAEESESSKCEPPNSESLVQKDVCMVSCKDMVNIWKKVMDTHSLTNLSTGEIQQLVIAEIVKNGENLSQEIADSLMVLIEKENNVGSLSSKLITTLQQNTSNALIRQSECSLDITVGVLKNQDPDTSISCHECERDLIVFQSRVTEAEQSKLSDSMALHLNGFQQIFTEFECTANEKLGMLSSRLEEVEQELHPLVQQAVSLKQRKTLYKNAFIRRCQNLDKAEIEVDMLGDQVEVLQDLLENIYKTLHQHLPIIEHNFEVSAIMKLIHKELFGGNFHSCGHYLYKRI